LLTSKTGFAKELSAIYEADWPTMLEQVKVYTLEWVRRGEPVTELWGEDESEPPTYLIEPLIVEGYPNVIFGDPGCFKSGLAVIVAAILTLPWCDNPLAWPEPEKPVPCLYLDWETDRKTVNWTHARLRRGHGLEGFPIHYRRCFAPLFNDIEAITELADACEAKAIIIDSLGMASGNDDLNNSTTATNFYRGLRQLNRTSIILAHNAKDRERKERSIYGNQYFTAQARNIWEVRKVQETGEDCLDLGLFHRKAPPFARFSKPFGMHIEFQDNSITVKAKEPDTIRELLTEMSLQQQIYDLLVHEGAKSLDEIAKNLEGNKQSVKTTLYRMRDKKVAVQVDGKWGLLASPDTWSSKASNK
jgi:DNA-directed RNA polymerase specialized sigma24 family protein